MLHDTVNSLFSKKVFAGIVLMLIFLLLCVVASVMMWIVRLFVPSVRGDLVYGILRNERMDQVDRYYLDVCVVVYACRGGQRG